MRPNIPCFIIPISNDNLIFPESMLAEVLTIDEREPSHRESAFSGWLDWSRRRVPIINIDWLYKPDIEKKPIRRVVVMYTILGSPDLPFIALQAEGIPHSVVVSENTLQDADKVIESPYVASHLQLSSLPCILPDWPRVEEYTLAL